MRPSRNFFRIVGALLAALALGFWLLVVATGWYFRKEFEENQTYFAALLGRRLTVAQLEEELREDPIRVVGPLEGSRVSRIWTDPRNTPEQIEKRIGAWAETRIYRKSPYVCSIYFDREGLMSDFSCLAS
jgi:hypothetical protein